MDTNERMFPLYILRSLLWLVAVEVWMRRTINGSPTID
jgi:hypothetical protein